MCSINKYLTEKMIDYHIIEPEDIEIYTYGLTNGFIIIVNIFTTLLFAYFIKKKDIAIIMLLSFIPLRSFSGGIHCKKKLRIGGKWNNNLPMNKRFQQIKSHKE